jgi:hypothetical protein
MMDRGKRPASRLNDLNDFGDFPTESQLEKEKELEGLFSFIFPNLF